MADKKVKINIGYTVDKTGLEEMQSYFQRIANQAAEPGNKLNTGLQQAGKTAQTLDNILEKTFNTNLGTLNVTKFNQELQKSGLTIKQIKIDLTSAGNLGVDAYNRLAQAILSTNIQLKQSSKLLDSMFTTFKNTVRYGISSSIFNNFTNSIAKAYDYTRKLDTSLNNIRIVTGQSAEQMDKFAIKANNAAKQLGASTLDVTEASLIYYQQGLSDAEAQARAETTVKVANVTSQSADEVSEQLTAVWNGYKVSADEAELHVDKLAAVAATTASDLEELSTGMSKVASAASSMGVNFDDLTAQISTIVSVTRQAPESVGTALKTIYARLGDLKVDGVDEFGTKLGEVSSQLQVMGIEILDQNGNMRDMSSVMAEVAQKWQTWTEAQRQAAAVAMAGKRQYNNLIALFNNWDMYSDALETAANAAGTLQKQQDIYMESTQAKLTKLRATWQDLYKSVGDTKTINVFIDGIRDLVQVFDNFSDSFGGGLKSITAFGTVIANIFNKQITESIKNVAIRASQLKQNLENTRAKMAVIQADILDRGENENPTLYDQANIANSVTQKNIAQELLNVQAGLTQEEARQGIEYQNILGSLKEEQVLLEGNMQSLLQQTAQIKDIELTDEQRTAIMQGQKDEYLILQASVEETLNQKKEQLKQEERIKNTLTAGLEGSQKSAIKLKENLISILSNIEGSEEVTKKLQEEFAKTPNKVKDVKEVINNILSQQKNSIKNCEVQIQQIEQINKNLGKQEQYSERIQDNRSNQQSYQIELDSLIAIGEKASKVGQVVTSVTSSLDSMTMAWSSVNSLFQTWSDETVEFGDKITQTIMTVSFTLPMLIKGFKDLGAAFGITTTLSEAFGAISARNAAIDQLKLKGIKLTIKELKGLNAAEIEELITSKAGVFVHLDETGAIVNESSAKAIDEKVTKSLTASQLALNASVLAFPGTWIVAALAAVVGIGAAVTAYHKKQIETQRKLNEETVVTVQKTIEEAEANHQLYDSLEQIYGKYKEGIAAKEDMAKAAKELADKYNLEGVALANLTGNYDDLIEAAKKARKEELEKGLGEAERGLKAQANIIRDLDSGSEIVNSVNLDTLDSQTINAIYGSSSKKEASAISSLKALGAKFADDNHYLELPTVDMNDIDSVKEYYDTIYYYYENLDSSLSAKDKNNSQYYKSLKNIVDELGPAIEKYNELEESQNNFQEQLVFNEVDFEQITNLEEYEEKEKEVRKAFEDLHKYTKEQIDDFINSYIKKSSNAIVQSAKAIEELGEKYSETVSLSLSDKEFLISGKGKLVLDEIEGLDTKEIHKRIEIAKAMIPPEDLTVPISLMTKLTSTKLSKTELKEFQEQENELAKKYDVEFANFNNKSMLDQSDTMNQIIQQEVQSRKDLIQVYKEEQESLAILYKEQIDEREEERQGLESKKQELQSKIQELQNEGISSQFQAEQLTIYQEQLRQVEKEENKVAESITDFQDKIKNLDFSSLESLSFETWTNGIDATINSIKTLNNSIADIGENWAIATDKIEDFAMNYPTILTDQENFNYLQDGSIALTEKGQLALQNQIDLRKEDIKTQGTAYMLELQKQADLQYAQAQYYQDQIDALENYLNGNANAAETEKALRESVYNFSAKVAELTGRTNEEVMGEIINNSKIATEAERDDTQAIFDYWVDCGNAVSAYGQAVLSQGFTYNPPEPKALNGRNTGSNLSKEDLDTWDKNYKEELENQTENLKKDTEEQRKSIEDQIDTLKKLRDAAITRGDIELAKRASYDAQINALENNLSNLGKSKNSKDKKQEQFDDEFDRYYDIKKAIDLVNNALDKLSKIQDKLHGKELIQSLKNENDLIKQQSKNYEELYRQQKIELEEIQGTLSNMGAEFDDNGYLTNYASLTASALEQYETKIAEYNAGKISEEAKTAYEKSYEQLKKYLDRYDALFYSEMKDTQDKLDENQRKIMENNLKMWETEIQIRLDTSQAKRDWADFLKEINEDFRKIYKDLNIEMDHLMTKMETYSGLGTIATDLQAVQDVMIEIDKIESGQGSDMFESTSDAQEKLKELDKQLEDDAKNMKGLWEEAWDAYLEGIDQAESKLDFMNDRFEKINKELEFQSKLIELLYGDEAYDLMDKLYKGQEAMIHNNIAGVQEQANMWHRLWEESGATLENQSDWTEDQEKYYENWQDQQSKLNDLVTNYIELLQTDYLNTVNDVLSKLEKSITGGNVLEDVKDQWDKISSYTDKYFDSIEQIYEAQKFANKIDADIAKTTGRNQQKLMAIREKEITYLREKKNLTQYDLDAAEARYQITLKEIALEEAQNNKTSMKLVRNEEGNWAYQYMADADDVADKQDDLLTSYGDLYKLAGDAYQKNLEELQSLEESYLASAQKIAEKYREDPIKLQEELNRIEAEYQEDKNRLVEENTLYRNDLQTSGAGLLLQVYNQDEEAYDFMTQSEKAMLDSLIGYSISSYQELEVACAENYNNIQQASESAMTAIREDWTASAQLIAETWAADDGQSVMSQVIWAQEQIGQAALDYQTLVDECALQVERDFGTDGISGSINGATQETYDLQDAITELCDTSQTQLDGLKEVLSQLELAWMAQKNKVAEVIEEVKRYIAIVGKANQIAANSYGVTNGTGNIGNFDINGNEISGGGTGNELSDFAAGDYVIMGRDGHAGNRIVTISNNNGKGFQEKDLAAAAAKFKIKESPEITEVKKVPKWLEENIFKEQKWKTYAEDFAFKTGGYTGTWGEDGRLAVLHQKELVLNAKDTSNFLNGISLLRDMVSLNGSIEQSIAAAIGGMALQLGGVSASNINNNSSQAAPAFAGDTYYVTADFPNANNAEEIKQAIMNLPNIVSQALGRNTI